MAAASHPDLESLRLILRKQINELTDNMAIGGCKDYPGYQNVVGEIYGLAWAESELLDLSKRIEEG